MKHFLTLLLLILTLLPASAVKKFEPNPINVAAVIVQKTDSAKVASTCEYYGFAYQGVEDGYTIMKRKNGTEIKFTFKYNGTLQKYPTVVVKVKEKHKDLDSLLKELSFEKVGNKYEYKRNIFSKFKTQCSFGHSNTLTFCRLRTDERYISSKQK